ncbi:microtubule-binding protein MIP-T3-domain-containing protein [Polychytrium aggregatum]|uniref:microtubule-binding protein MIP-T3-domain-containing protein n=1 Tax=Polychytrium aggregatum TaxID=110093 RepID=UPI0022FDE851|nr:microtubule-binding protein MIP-T3-domain-containing protein [Polychytrium aggregatum]KAI9199442.1 microtubule-binding protein MIP-T3-domain-containing protein [Polychytrium aggregatum]
MSSPPQEAPTASPIDDATKKTIDILGRIIKKPPLNGKLLSKPPFRYLHDMFTEIIKTTGFAVGLYSDAEMNSENVKEKDAKVAYLSKMINCAALATGVEVKANPLKIVAGMDPIDTNVFLQLIGKAVLKKVDSTNAVKRVLAGEQQPIKKPAPQAAPALAPVPAAAPTAPAPVTKAPAAAPPKTDDKPRPVQQPQQATSQPKPELTAGVAPAATVSKPELPKPAPAQQAALTQPSQQRPSQPPAQNQAPQKTVQPVPAQASQPRPAVPAQAPPQATSAQPSAPQSMMVQRQGSGGSDPSDSTHSLAQPIAATDDVVDESFNAPDDERMRMALQPKRRERPSSARPAPPKQRAADVVMEEIPTNMPAIITENETNDDEEENFVVTNAVAQPVIGRPDAAQRATGDDEQHGGLVKKILDTKREFEPTEGKKDGGLDGQRTVIIKDDKASAQKEIEKLRETIQTLCQSTNPLGKTMDYMQEDADSMNKELQMWRVENLKYRELLAEELSKTAGVLEPFETQLKEMEQSIEEYEEKIRNSKVVIIQNDLAIQKLLRSITHPIK